MSFLNTNMDSNETELGVSRQGFEDEMFLQRLSVYATIRPDDLKGGSRISGHRSLADLLQDWRLGRAVDDEEAIDEEPQLELREHELPVKGFEIDSRIAPGFRYYVRYLGTNEFLFDGEARLLESIGLGYGRRLTFKGDRLNFNDCYFWSDSIPNGFAFTINALREGDTYTIIDANSHAIGSVEIERVDFPQIEKNTVIEGKDVVKNVKVKFSCLLKLHKYNHSLVNVNTQDYEVVEGIAQLVKERGSREAIVKCIKNVQFTSIGKCMLHYDP